MAREYSRTQSKSSIWFADIEREMSGYFEVRALSAHHVKGFTRQHLNHATRKLTNGPCQVA